MEIENVTDVAFKKRNCLLSIVSLCLAQADIFQQVFKIPPCIALDEPGAIGGGKMEMLCQIN